MPGQDEKPELFSLDGENKQSQQMLESLDSCTDKSMEKELQSIAAVIRGQNKKQPTKHAKPIAWMRFDTRVGKAKPVTLKAPLDSGASDSEI